MLNPFLNEKLTVKNPKPFEKITEKPDIIKVYSYLFPQNKLKRSAKAMLALCPVHGESTPSFAMYEESNSYYCFACKTTGDSFKLIMEVENLNFKDALDYAERNYLYG